MLGGTFWACMFFGSLALLKSANGRDRFPGHLLVSDALETIALVLLVTSPFMAVATLVNRPIAGIVVCVITLLTMSSLLLFIF